MIGIPTTKFATTAKGEQVDIAVYNKLNQEQRDYLKKYGVDEYNKHENAVAESAGERIYAERVEKARQEAVAEFESKNTKLSTGEYIDNDIFNSLSPNDQARLKSMGIEKFNEAIRKEEEERQRVNAYNARAFAERQQWDATHGINQTANQSSNLIKLNNGEYINSSNFDAMNLAQQNYIMSKGVDAYNERMKQYESNVYMGEIQSKVLPPNKVEIDAANKEGIDYDEMTAPSMPTEAQQKVLGVKVTYSEPVVAHPPAYPEGNIQSYEPQEINKIADNIWKAITPWAEDKGETFQDYVKNFPSYLAAYYTEPTQEELAEGYQAFEESPLWYKLVFHGGVINPITKDSDGKYGRIIQGEAPMISAASGGLNVAKQAFSKIKPLLIVAPIETGLSDAAYLRFLNARVTNPNLSIEGFKSLDGLLDFATKNPIRYNTDKQVLSELFQDLNDVVNSGKSKQAILKNWQNRHNIRKNLVSKVTTYVDEYGTPSVSDYWQKYGEVNPFEPNTIPNWYSTAAKSVKVEKPIIETAIKVKQSVNKVGQLITAPSFTKAEIAEELIRQSAVTVALAVNPIITLNILENVSPVIRNAIMATISPKISEAIDAGQSQASIQRLAQSEIVWVTDMVNQSMTEPQTATKLQSVTKDAIEAQLQSQTQLEAQTQLKEQTKTQTQTQLQTQAKLQTQTEPMTQLKTQTKLQTRLEPQLIAKTGITNRISEPIIPKIRLSLPSGYENLTDTQIMSMIAWKQGIMYKAIYQPYGKNDIINTRKPINGVKYYKGVGSAAKSAIARGVPPEVINRDMGIVDIKITTKVGSMGDAIPVIIFAADSSNYSNNAKHSKRISNHSINNNASISGMR